MPAQLNSTHTVDTQPMADDSAVVYIPGKESRYIPNSDRIAEAWLQYGDQQPDCTE